MVIGVGISVLVFQVTMDVKSIIIFCLRWPDLQLKQTVVCGCLLYHWLMICHVLLILDDDMSYVITIGRWNVVHYCHWSVVCCALSQLYDDVSSSITISWWCVIHYYHWSIICHTLWLLFGDVLYINATDQW